MRIVLLLLLLIGPMAYGQGAKPMIYGQVGGGGIPGTVSILGSLNAYFGNHIIAVGLSGNFIRANNIPADYEKGTFLDSRPRHTLAGGYMLYGRMLNTNTSLVRVALRAGLSAGKASIITRYNHASNSSWLIPGSNYNPVYEDRMTVGLVLNPQFEFPLKNGFGLATGVFTDINMAKPVGAFYMSILFGRLKWGTTVKYQPL